MGLVQSQSEKPADAIEVDGLFFTMENSLKRLIPIYGNVVVDFKSSFFGEGFLVNFGRQECC